MLYTVYLQYIPWTQIFNPSFTFSSRICVKIQNSSSVPLRKILSVYDFQEADMLIVTNFHKTLLFCPKMLFFSYWLAMHRACTVSQLHRIYLEILHSFCPVIPVKDGKSGKIERTLGYYRTGLRETRTGATGHLKTRAGR